ncbi:MULTISPECIES: DUF3558 family protein [unclassified Streptomyces]|uniref:DUF3558 family protein n=1 Tax=unclassified Streptomyces TaxID=2593676 RepID=UPI000F6EA82E|nr:MULTISPECIES: DUF3558 family protein [unclassified Streptomyces]AZM60785.1 DUF3558 domain-containing protein [Streptomyces sp. WAC 01438]RSM96976.1 DUF3558 domain-containing protein [Streptomyces sp. WAC 01420]
MQRRAEREQPERAKRLTRVLVGAAVVPAMLIAAGCSSDSGSDDGKDKGADASASTSASPSPTVQAAAYKKLPEACSVLSKKTLDDLAPKAKSGKQGSSDDVSTRASCSWSSLDNNGVKGSQFRWLNVSLLRFDSDTTRGAGDKLAKEYYDKQVRDAQGTEGAKGTKAEPVTGTGDEATAVRYDLKKKEGTFKQQTVVARVENVVVTLDYNGAGLAGDKTPDAGDLLKDAQKAAKEAVASVTKANGTGSADSSPSQSASGKASSKPSPSDSKPASDKG